MLKNKFFIRGVKGREDEVIAILEGMGGKNTKCSMLDGEEGFIYFINNDGEIDYLQTGGLTEDLFTEFEELKLPPLKTFEDLKVDDYIYYGDENNCIAFKISSVVFVPGALVFYNESGLGIRVKNENLIKSYIEEGQYYITTSEEEVDIASEYITYLK